MRTRKARTDGPYRLVAWMGSDEGPLVPCKDVFRYDSLDLARADAEKMLSAARSGGNQILFIEILSAHDQTVLKLYREPLH